MNQDKVIFLRNDDVGLFSSKHVSTELMGLTNICIEEGIPINHGVVPAAVTKETVAWLLKIKSKYPDLIGIDQHGYAHVKHEVGEFGGARDYAEQKRDIVAGMQLMEEYFGPSFSRCFTVPWVKYNRTTKMIINELGYNIFSGGVSPKLQARVFNALGRAINLTVLGNKEVSYHRKNCFSQSGFSIPEISVSVDIINNYKEKTLKTNAHILERYEKCKKQFSFVGFMLHHWVFDRKEKLDQMRNLITELRKDKGISFRLLSDISHVVKTGYDIKTMKHGLKRL